MKYLWHYLEPSFILEVPACLLEKKNTYSPFILCRCCLFLDYCSPNGNTEQELDLYLAEIRSQNRDILSFQVSVCHLVKQNCAFQISSFFIRHLYCFQVLGCCLALQIRMCPECKHIQTSTSAVKFEFMLFKTTLHNLNLFISSILCLVQD